MSGPCRRKLWSALNPLVALLLLIGGARCAEPPPLANLVPDDAGLCLAIDGLAGQVRGFLKGPLFERWQAFPPWQRWAAENQPQLEQMAGQFGRQLGVPAQDLWQRVFGRRTLMAVWPMPGENQQNSPGLLLVEAEDAALVEQLLRGVRQAQERSGELIAARTIESAGGRYHEHQIRKNGRQSSIYFAVLGRVGAVASDEAVMRRLLDLHAQPVAQRASLANLPAFRAGIGRLDPQAALRLFVNPRQWDAAVDLAVGSAKDSGDSNRAAQRALLEGWRASDYCVASLTLDPKLAGEVWVDFQNLPAEGTLAGTLDGLTGEGEFLRRVPADCLLALVGSIHVGKLLAMSRPAPQSAAEIGDAKQPARVGGAALVWQALDQLLAGLGGNLGSYLVAAQESQSSAVPLDWVAGIEVQSQATTDSPPSSSADPSGIRASPPRVDEALHTLLVMAATLYNLQAREVKARIERQQVDAQRLYRLQVDNWPAEVPVPAAAVVERYLLAGTSSSAILQAAGLQESDSLAESRHLAALLGDRMGKPSHLLYANLAAVRQLIVAHGPALAALVARSKGVTLAESQRGLDQLARLLTLADRIVLAARLNRSGLGLYFSAAVEAGQQP